MVDADRRWISIERGACVGCIRSYERSGRGRWREGGEERNETRFSFEVFEKVYEQTIVKNIKRRCEVSNHVTTMERNNKCFMTLP